VSHLYGDEGIEYFNNLVQLADSSSVNVVWAGDRVGETRGFDESGRKIYRLWDIYPIVDFVTYPSLYEGFGNALLETFYFSKPALVNRYQVYKDDIEPHGFKVLSIDGQITEEVVNETIELFSNDEMANDWTKHNYKLCVENFSYNVLRSSLEKTLLRIFN
jgi:glycosyltransferase involved in cell wall biosynthesis